MSSYGIVLLFGIRWRIEFGDDLRCWAVKLLTYHESPRIVRMPMVWTASILLQWVSGMKGPHAAPAYVRIEITYILRMFSLVLIGMGLFLLRIG